jgi:starch-binding outer membrane protein, SusD/RagB family
MKSFIKTIILIILASFIFNSCMKDLDTVPLNKEKPLATNVFKDTLAFKEALAKLYASFVLSGQQGPAGDPDIIGIDEGFSVYLREYWELQELPTDEAVCGWGDAGIVDLHNQNWSPTNQFVSYLFARIMLTVTYCNEFIRVINTNLPLVSANLQNELKTYKAEARFIRALAYYNGLDLYGHMPFVTEADQVGAFFPKQISRADLFNYVEKELIEIDADLADARTNEYARADKACAWTLLAKLYLNAEVYINQPKYTECITNCKKVIDAGYSLNPVYSHLFLADNNNCTDEIIFPFTSDGVHTSSYGAMVYVIHAEVGGNMPAADYGIGTGWAGNRVTSAFVAKFPDTTGLIDKRAMFFTYGQTLSIDDITVFNDGLAITKFKNVNSDGSKPTYIANGHVDTDYPYFRLADVYLMYAEAVLRGGSGGNNSDAIQYVNLIRRRAYGNNTGDISSAELTLDFILDERARELYWEGTRRIDLIRYGRLTGGDYIWQWKGGVKDGMATDAKFNIFPIPSAELTANPNLEQNIGYE